MRLPKTKRWLVLEGNKVVMAELEITKYATPNVEKEFMHLDKLPDGTWRLLVNIMGEDGTRIDISDVQVMRIKRED